MQLIGVTRHCTLGNCEPIVLIDESVPEGHDLIASLGSRKGVETHLIPRLFNELATCKKMH